MRLQFCGERCIHCLLLTQSNCAQRQLPSCPESRLGSHSMTCSLRIYILEARQPWSTASHLSTAQGHRESSQTVTTSHCCSLRSTDSYLEKMVCTKESRSGCHPHSPSCHPHTPSCPTALLFTSSRAPFYLKKRLQTGSVASTGIGSLKPCWEGCSTPKDTFRVSLVYICQGL